MPLFPSIIAFIFVGFLAVPTAVYASDSLAAEDEISLQAILQNPFGHGSSLEDLVKTLPEESQQIWINDLKFACLAWQKELYKTCADQLQNVLNYPIFDNIKNVVLKYLCLANSHLGDHSQEILSYECFLETYPNDPNFAPISLKLASLYRQVNVPERAIYHYYTVMNRAITVPQEQLERYKSYVTWAQLGVAECHLMAEKPQEALECFEKIHLNTLDEALLREVSFKKALCAYQLQQYEKAVQALTQFCDKNVMHPEAPRAYFLRVQCCQALHLKKETLENVMQLLELGQAMRVERQDHWKDWDHWQKEAALDVAKNFYDAREFVDALKIYQVLVTLETEADWQWPILHQIALCYERLGLTLKSKAAYQLMVDAKDSWEGKPLVLTSALQAYQTQAQWHLEQLAYYEKLKNNVEGLLNINNSSANVSTRLPN